MDTMLLEKALNLPPNERVMFAELILASLEREDDEVRLAWQNEVNERIKAVNQGKAKLLDFDALFNAS
ncbi:MAG: addiction module protein [Ignavibacteriales bacterium]|nr:addiction module protein [Ignavibacteriales bacterium]MBK7377423.1 addiction module protein [Ignavibacteriales bacterium]